MRFAVDIPNADGESAWENVGYFSTRAKAISFAQQHYGADDKGRIALVSEMPADDYGEED